MKHYFQYRIFDWILCVGISLGLVFHVYSGFYLSDSMSSNVLKVFTIVCLLQLILFGFGYSKKTKIVGMMMAIIVFLGFILIVHQNPFANEQANSLVITWIITILTSMISYFMTRTKIGTLCIILLGNIIIAGCYILQFPIELWQFILFVFCGGVMYWYRNYCMTLLHVDNGKIKLMQYIMQSLVLCTICLLISGGFYYAVIKPLNPPSEKITLLTKIESIQMLQVLGVSGIKEIPNPDISSNQQGEENVYSKIEGEDEGDINEDTNIDTDQQDELDTNNNDSVMDEQVNSNDIQDTTAVTYDLKSTQYPWKIILIVVCILGIFILRIVMKKQWRTKINKLSREDAVINYYEFFLSRLSRTGYKKAQNFTLNEYAQKIEHEMQVFAVDDITFTKLTDIYITVLYGRKKVNSEEIQLFEQFYNEFYKNLRKEIGFVPYYIKLFLI